LTNVKQILRDEEILIINLSLTLTFDKWRRDLDGWYTESYLTILSARS